MIEVSWFEREEDWVLKCPVIFSKKMTQFTFLEVNGLLKLVGPLNESGRVLDLCCGIGRHSIALARKGFRVTAVDITKPYLNMAMDSASQEGLSIDFLQSDMRNFCRPDSFDLIVNLGTSFGYFENAQDDITVLENVYKSLAGGGKFVIEILGKEVVAATFRRLHEMEFDGFRVISESRVLEDWRLIECKRTIVREDSRKEIIAYHRIYS